MLFNKYQNNYWYKTNPGNAISGVIIKQWKRQRKLQALNSWVQDGHLGSFSFLISIKFNVGNEILVFLMSNEKILRKK